MGNEAGKARGREQQRSQPAWWGCAVCVRWKKQSLRQKQQREQARVQADVQIAEAKSQADAMLEKQKQDFEAWKVQFEAQNKLNLARIAANPGVDVPLLEAQELQSKQMVQQLAGSLNDAINRMTDLHQNMLQMQAQTMAQIEGVKNAASAPKRVIRGADGKVIGVEVVQ